MRVSAMGSMNAQSCLSVDGLHDQYYHSILLIRHRHSQRSDHGPTVPEIVTELEMGPGLCEANFLTLPMNPQSGKSACTRD